MTEIQKYKIKKYRNKTREIQITKLQRYKLKKYKLQRCRKKNHKNTEMQVKKSYPMVQEVPLGPRGT